MAGITEGHIWDAGIPQLVGVGVGPVIQGGDYHPVREAPPRLVLLVAVPVPVRVVGIPVSHQYGVPAAGDGRRVEVVDPLVILA